MVEFDDNSVVRDFISQSVFKIQDFLYGSTFLNESRTIQLFRLKSRNGKSSLSLLSFQSL